MKIISAATFFFLAMLLIIIGVDWMSGELALTVKLMQHIIYIMLDYALSNNPLVLIIGLGLFVIGILFFVSFAFTILPIKKTK